MKNLCKIRKNTGDPANRYDKDEVDEMIMLIRDSFIPAYKHVCISHVEISPYNFESRDRGTKLRVTVSTVLVCFFQIKPPHRFHFLFLQDESLDVNRLLIDVDKGNFVVPEDFSVKFFCKISVDASGKCKIFRPCMNSQLFCKFPQAGCEWFIACLNVTGGRRIVFSGERIFAHCAFLHQNLKMFVFPANDPDMSCSMADSFRVCKGAGNDFPGRLSLFIYDIQIFHVRPPVRDFVIGNYMSFCIMM